MNDRRVLVSIHDVTPRFDREIDVLAELIGSQLGAGGRFAMLVVPNHWGDSPIAGNAAFRQRLRSWSDAGVEMFVHGWFHRDDGHHTGVAKFKARAITAGEGEFLGLTQTEASARMQDGRALIEDIIGRSAAGFIAPAWLYGAGAMAALKGSGFALAEDHMRIWRPSDGAVLARGPVVTWASRSPARAASSLAFAALARATLGRLQTVRIAVHPGDVTRRSLLASIEATLHRFAATHSPSRYADLLA